MEALAALGSGARQPGHGCWLWGGSAVWLWPRPESLGAWSARPPMLAFGVPANSAWHWQVLTKQWLSLGLGRETMSSTALPHLCCHRQARPQRPRAPILWEDRCCAALGKPLPSLSLKGEKRLTDCADHKPHSATTTVPEHGPDLISSGRVSLAGQPGGGRQTRFAWGGGQ